MLPLPSAPPAAIKSRASDVTRERLLQAAHELLLERVGGHVSVQDICTRAGTNIAMVKYCFGSKEKLLGALINRITSSFTESLQKLDALSVPPAESLRLHITAIVRGYVRYPYLNRLINSQLMVAVDSEMEALSRNYAIPMHQWHQKILLAGQKAGAFRNVDATLFFFTVIGMAEFFFTAQPLLHSAFDADGRNDDLIERFITHTTGMLLHGVCLADAESGKP